MRFKVDLEQFEEFIETVKNMEESLEELTSNFENLKDIILDTNEGTAIEKFNEISEEKIEQMNKLNEVVVEVRENLEDYNEEFLENDETELVGEYEIDTEIKHSVKKIIKILENMDYSRASSHFENEIEEIENQKIKYNDVDETIDVKKEYEDEEDTQQYILKRRNEIDEDISNYTHNVGIYNDILDAINTFERNN